MITKNVLSILATFTILLVGFVLATSTADGVSIAAVTGLPSEVVPGDEYIVEVRVTTAVAILNDSGLTLEWINTSTSDLIWNDLVETNLSIANGTTDNYTAELMISEDFEGSESILLKANVYDNRTLIGSIEQQFTATYTAPGFDDFCTVGEDFIGQRGELEIVSFDITNLGEGDDEDVQIFDELEIEVEVRNDDRNDDIRDVRVEILITDDNGNDMTNEFDLEDEEVKLGKIQEDEEEIATFVVEEIPSDIEDGKYRIYVRAYSDDDPSSDCASKSDDFNDASEHFHEFDIDREEEQAVILKRSELTESTVVASCGDNQVQVSFPVYNIGEDKEDSVLVSLFNSLLGIDELVVIDGLRDGKKENVDFFIDVPENLDKERYDLEIVTYFDYDEDDGDEDEFIAYDMNSDTDLDKTYFLRLDVIGCQMPVPSVSASLESEAMIGEELIVRTTVTNTGDEGTFAFAVSGYESWANVLSITPQSINLPEGESIEVLVKLAPTESGSKTFTFKTVADGKTYEQPVTVTISEKPSAFGNLGDLDRNTVYLIVGIVVLLILILIILIVRVSKRNSSSEY